MTKKKQFDINKMTSAEKLRFEIARELGLSDKIISNGWGELTASESGRIGGILSQRNRQKKKTKK
jgi:hypothetical protein